MELMEKIDRIARDDKFKRLALEWAKELNEDQKISEYLYPETKKEINETLENLCYLVADGSAGPPEIEINELFVLIFGLWTGYNRFVDMYLE